MFEARYVSPEDGSAKTIRIEDYNEKRHEGHLLCADDCCNARVHFRNGGLTHGAAKPRSSHFCSYNNRDHREGCTHHNPDMEERNLQNLQEAVRAGKRILINLNLKVSEVFNRAVRPDSPYEKFCAQFSGNYHTISAKSVNDILRIREMLLDASDLEVGQDILARTYVGHCGQVCPFKDFFIDADGSKLKTLFNVLRGAPDSAHTAWSYAPNFPRIFRFMPTKKTQEQGRQNGAQGWWYMNGTHCKMGQGTSLTRAAARGEISQHRYSR
ncbi:MAG: hypothetical protein LRY62_03160 [Alphaproteobacteria bacterium]|nr:hypothetical protein [Alphaproteobacteria bacterium]